MKWWLIALLKTAHDASRGKEGSAAILVVILLVAVIVGCFLWVRRARKEGFVATLKKDSHLILVDVIWPAARVLLILSAFIFLLWLFFAEK